MITVSVFSSPVWTLVSGLCACYFGPDNTSRCLHWLWYSFEFSKQIMESLPTSTFPWGSFFSTAPTTPDPEQSLSNSMVLLVAPVGSVIATKTQAAHQVPFSHRIRMFKAILSSNASNDLVQTHPHPTGHVGGNWYLLFSILSQT